MTLVLGFDTSGAHCAAALLDGDAILGQTAQEMGRGQAEHLMPMLEDLLAAHGRNWRDLTAISVGIGPGNFTGIRISVSAARGLALALDIPARGITTFDATVLNHDGACLPIVPAPRNQVYLRLPGSEPTLAPAETAQDHGLPLLTPPPAATLAANIARIAARGEGQTPPAPLYVRPADAAPSKTPPPVILSDDT
ncbi:tRNA (adenosine(37)-N6)-threonylcarbamoyltransferase complex dimerization subunit type 1 TsaB [Alisedimentitalea sp. MJ-SS2]|uniref:tRNA (adenosine(37)-N6)-threonylcarbamoyltransferase complex dimerization subunit type 1 TsaB n=1 Tax=Aliisedimentitalea sp. MJ-SS2 TaxID=3049795 RepID=UPI00290A6454|nr:tRNA (adenosine(37)-N6)-threonylcarbamoyltransferase complex dimerization subunit type 1 TsaB [Alisedimentitalea sp. MJ-SS2]MDU8928786.1 tRNA (adenosine(37)-N6)-threonylcarbamoyltransferase complex dimerization subunit type 1 TsaB [Alisedimentitalea sp. MJ-SS2]